MRERKNTRNNQTLYLFLGFLTLFVLSFTLGVIVGKGLSNSEEPHTAREDMPPESPHKEVTESENESDTITKDASTAKQTSPTLKEELEPQGTKITEEPIAEQTPTPSTRTEEIVEQSPAIREPLEEKAESETAKNKEQTSATATTIEEQATVESDKEQATQREIAAMPKIDSGGEYTVQIGSFQEEVKAKQILESLRSKGYPVFIKQVEIPGQGTRYRARVGTFKTREDARLYGEDLKNREADIVKLVLVTINN
ncbi:MAG: SPOR domain-containing protein [Deltaproteobacteria bacterium]|nr:SPOR domain-containing protein [Deltaproteobacteria bacterium]